MERQPNKSATATWTNLRTGWLSSLWKDPPQHLKNLQGSLQNTVVPSVFSNDQIHTPTWLHAEVMALKFSPLAEVVALKLGWERKGWMTMALYPPQMDKMGKNIM